MKSNKPLKTFIVGFISINIIWIILSLFINKPILPMPLKVYKNMLIGFEDDILLHIGASFIRIFIGVSSSLVLGFIIGLIMTYSKLISKILKPLVYFLYPIPKTVLLPMIMLLFGLGDISKIILIALIIIFQVIVVVRDSISNISTETYNLIDSLGASKIQKFKHITLPAILPELLTNLRLSVGTSLSILFFAEAYGTKYGLGYYILDSWNRMDYLDMYMGIVVISLMGFLLFVVIDRLEAQICPWKK